MNVRNYSCSTTPSIRRGITIRLLVIWASVCLLSCQSEFKPPITKNQTSDPSLEMESTNSLSNKSDNASSQLSMNAGETKSTVVKEDSLASNTPTIFVSKRDGSVQCDKDQKTKIALNEMAKELEGIHIFSSKNQNDGKMRMQVCESPTGQFNVYEIAPKDLPEAKKRGFTPWSKSP